MKKIRLEFPSNQLDRIWLKVTDNKTQAFHDKNFSIPIISTNQKISLEISVPQKLELIQVDRTIYPSKISFNWTGKEIAPYGRMPGLKKVSIIFNDRTFDVPVIDEQPNLDDYNYCREHDYWLNHRKIWSLTVCTFESKTIAFFLWHPLFILDLKSRKRTILLSKNGLPCLWEKGGRIDESTGNSTIICDANGNKKKPIFIKRKGTLSCSEHALIVIKKNDVIVEVNYQEYYPFEIKILRIINININARELEVDYIDYFSIFLMDTPDRYKYSIKEYCEDEIPKYQNAILSAYKKAICYNCKEPYFIKTE